MAMPRECFYFDVFWYSMWHWCLQWPHHSFQQPGQMVGANAQTTFLRRQWCKYACMILICNVYYIYIHSNTYACVRSQTHVQTRTHMNTHTHTHICSNACVSVYIAKVVKLFNYSPFQTQRTSSYHFLRLEEGSTRLEYRLVRFIARKD